MVNDVTGWIPSTYLEPVKTDPEESLLERSGELLKDSQQGEGGGGVWCVDLLLSTHTLPNTHVQ